MFSCGPSTAINIVMIELPTIVATAKAAKTYENNNFHFIGKFCWSISFLENHNRNSLGLHYLVINNIYRLRDILMYMYICMLGYIFHCYCMCNDCVYYFSICMYHCKNRVINLVNIYYSIWYLLYCCSKCHILFGYESS